MDSIILDRARGTLGTGVSPSERRAWHQSLTHMRVGLGDPGIPEDAGVGVEFQIPQTAKRIDVFPSGRNDSPRDQAVIVELKHWETAEPTAQVKGEAERLRGFIKKSIR